VRITIKTPKNQAKACIESQKNLLLGHKLQKNIFYQELVNDHIFFWELTLDNEKDLEYVTKRAAMGEVLIKKFFHTLIKWVSRAAKLAGKFKRGAHWAKLWIIRQAKKHYKESDDFVKYIEEMKDDDLKTFLTITDKEEMLQLMAGSLIDIKKLPESET